jgi:hypothetical protein
VNGMSDIIIPLIQGFDTEEEVIYLNYLIPFYSMEAKSDMATNVKSMEIPAPVDSITKDDGTKSTGIITKIEAGLVKEFIPEKYWAQWRAETLDKESYYVTVETPDKHVIKTVFPISSSKKSNIQRFKLLYGVPKVGMKVETFYSEGYENLRL